MADIITTSSTYSSGTNDTASTLVNNVSPTDAKHINGPATAIIQIETVLGSGTGLVGSKADLNTRLAVNVQPDGIIIPPGVYVPYGGSSAPTGWLLCDGSAVSRSTYAALFAAIGTAYGPGNGTTTFNVPDMRGRSPVGAGAGTGGGASGAAGTAPSGGSGITNVTVGSWKGEELHVLTTGELASHAHVLTDPGHAHTEVGASTSGTGATVDIATTGTNTPNDTVAASAAQSNTTGITMANTGSNTGHNTYHPVIGGNFIIKT